MGILTANLKHFYQRRILWLFYVFLPLPFVWVFSPSLPDDGGTANGRTAALLVVVVLGVMLGSCQREVASRPFASLLPRHAWVVPRQALIPALLFGALSVLLWAKGPGPATARDPILLGAAWSLGTACYMTGTVLAFKLPYVSPIVGFFPLTVMLCSATALPRLVVAAVTAAPLPATFAGLGATVWAWHALGRREVARRCCVRKSISVFDEFNVGKAAEYRAWRRARKVERSPEPGDAKLERTCLDGIRRSGAESVRRYWYAVWYEWFGHMTRQNQVATLVMLAPLSAFLGYAAGGESALFVFLLPAGMVVTMRPVHKATYVPVGRQQRWVLAGTGMMAIAVLQAMTALLVVTISQYIAPLMPPLSVHGRTVLFRPFPYLYALAPLTFAPPAFALVTWIRRRTILLPIVVMPILVVAVLLLQKFGFLTPGVCAGVLALSLVSSLWALRHHCLHRDIV